MKKMIVAVMLFLVISSQMDSVEPSATDCLDACSTGCVNTNTRLLLRCERKCEIKCGPDNAVSIEYLGTNF